MGLLKQVAREIGDRLPMTRAEKFTNGEDNELLLGLNIFGVLILICFVIIFTFTIGAFMWNEGAVPLNTNLKAISYKGGQLRLLAFTLLNSWFFW
uniref:Uncharacterized protein n=1 Tax=viral metagenome TaxID=1070528 RepID=A0A6C0KAH8_9ZZZZ